MDTMRWFLGRVMKPDPRVCEETRALMSDFLDGELDEESHRRVERHVRFCPRCHTVLGNLRHTVARLRGLGEERSSANEDAVAARIARTWRERA